ncbi:hypothetical protein FM109_17045 [Vibrio casei]|uniref:Uncharacterized protein n=1 Tax=Vibrio casei TaxID=673372 RepID=A0A368LKK4_9VIBR|nr:hypothetical protein CIK83_15970 [Vibrio casei]SJN40357.1 hypothetical protein FM109_17045 [Vibrio casei]HBV76668.1 hypothetical protein [Vibrio sp.]
MKTRLKIVIQPMPLTKNRITKQTYPKGNTNYQHKISKTSLIKDDNHNMDISFRYMTVHKVKCVSVTNKDTRSLAQKTNMRLK